MIVPNAASKPIGKHPVVTIHYHWYRYPPIFGTIGHPVTLTKFSPKSPIFET
jgi:hypothetical protein